MIKPFKSAKVRLALILWRVFWFVGMPGVLFYLWRRARADSEYGRHLRERFGWHTRRDHPHVWVHAVSFGELRSAEPVIRALLADGHRVVTTHFTPAGRRACHQVFAAEIASGHVSAVWVPFDYGLAFRRFFKAFQPRYGLVMEVEMWPGMIAASARQGVPLFLCNGQYPSQSFAKDAGKFLSRRDIVSGFAGVMVKNDVQAERFKRLGQTNVAITGEMRFEMPINAVHLAMAKAHRGGFDPRPITTFASVVEGEDALFIAAIKNAGQRTVYVPRAPERFDESYDLLKATGLKVLRRSDLLGPTLETTDQWPQDWDILLGDSMGEMTYYLGLADRAVIGGGFVPKGSHNIIEPLALGVPVIVGPHIWTIEFPAVEAIAAGVAQQVTAEGLADALVAPTPDAPINAFLAKHGGSVSKTLAALRQFGIGSG
jgi:3-deoxy-D-manno-octulosonic-acid transferase